MTDRVYTRIDAIRKHVDEMLLQNEDQEARRNGYVHLYAVGMAAALIALKRGYEPEVAAIAGILHDFICYQGWEGPEHAHECEPVIRKLLNEIDITTDEETEFICSAVLNHSDKLKVGSDFDEIIKDADVMHHWLRNPAEPVSDNEAERVERLRREFSLGL